MGEFQVQAKSMKISVYITSYNQKEYLIEAIESVLQQTLSPSQIIVIDDCSTDGSQEVIAQYAKQYPEVIEPIYHAKNQGIAKTRIDALEAVVGDYVTYVDGDDRFLPKKLEKEAEAFKKGTNAKIIFSNNFYINKAGDRTGLWVEDEEPPDGLVFSQTFSRNYPRQQLFRNELVDYDAWRHIGFHDPNLLIYEDYDMKVRLTKYLPVAYCDEPLAEYRRHDKGLSGAAAIRHFDACRYIYRKNKDLLNDLTDQQVKYVHEHLFPWLENLASRALQEALENNRRIEACRLLFASRNYVAGGLDTRSLLHLLRPALGQRKGPTNRA